MIPRTKGIRPIGRLCLAGTLIALLGITGCPRSQVPKANEAEQYADPAVVMMKDSQVLKGLVDRSTACYPVLSGRLSFGNIKLTKDEAEIARIYIDYHEDISAYPVLMVLRRDFPEIYKHIAPRVKASILCANLRETVALNDWSVLETGHDSMAATALLETGPVAIQFLMPLLRDKRPAFLEGSEEATSSRMYNYRRCDFAYRYVFLVLGRQPTFEADQEKRDSLIDELIREKIAK